MNIKDLKNVIKNIYEEKCLNTEDNDELLHCIGNLAFMKFIEENPEIANDVSATITGIYMNCIHELIDKYGFVLVKKSGDAS